MVVMRRSYCSRFFFTHPQSPRFGCFDLREPLMETSVLIKSFDDDHLVFAQKQFGEVRQFMRQIAEDGGGRLKWSGSDLRFCVPGHHPNLNETIAVKNLRAIVHGRYSIARGCMVRAEIDPTSLDCLPHELKEHLKLMKQQEEKKEGKEARQRKNNQKYKAGRAALLFK